MKRQIRRGVFETNSSSTHSLTMCSEEEFEAWKRGEVLFQEYGEENFISATKLSEHDKKWHKKIMKKIKTIFRKIGMICLRIQNRNIILNMQKRMTLLMKTQRRMTNICMMAI